MASSVLSSYLLSDPMVQVPSAAMSSCQRHSTLSEHFALSLMTSQAQEVLDWDSGLSLRTSSGPWHPSIYLSSMFLYYEGKQTPSSFLLLKIPGWKDPVYPLILYLNIFGGILSSFPFPLKLIGRAGYTSYPISNQCVTIFLPSQVSSPSLENL